MSKRSDLKWFVFFIFISILLQFYLIDPGDTIWTVLGLGVFCGLVSFGFKKLIDWWLR